MRRNCQILSIFVLITALSLLPFESPAQAACGIGTAGTTKLVKMGETGRAMKIHLPLDFDAVSPRPLVLLLHGSGQTGATILDISGFTATADKHGFIVAAPDAGIPLQNGFFWNIPDVPTVTGQVPDADDADDAAYLDAAMDWLVLKRCVDPARIYATGLSGGGRMASWLGCVASDRFAAIAPVVGLRAGHPTLHKPRALDPSTCRPSKPMPVMAFAGDKDNINPIQGGGRAFWQYSMHTALQRWALLNSCSALPTTKWVASVVYEERYSNCRLNAEVIGRVTVGGGHEWRVADNEVMWTFFAQHRRD